ncbi:MAG: ATPase [Candidatus Nanohalarchaeota archaeon]|nr:MAG: ATPase [Candidatus Nanohaloarchaeota archaeon]
MLIGEVVGKTGTKTFRFRAYKDVNKLDFVTVKNKDNQWVLAQIDNIEGHPDGRNIAQCIILGYREKGALLTPKTPVKPSTLVYTADKEVINKTLNLSSGGLYIGKLDANKDVSVYLDPEELISKHVGVLAATGSGKSYTVAVILEELLEQDIPVVVIDPHGEYSTLKLKNDNLKEISLMAKYGIEPKSYNVSEYSPDPRINPGAKQLTFSDKNLSAHELAQLFPAKATSSQIGLLYTATREAKSRGNYTLDDVITYVSNSENSSKWNVVNMLEIIKDMKLFSKNPTKLQDIVKSGRASLINLRGINPEIQSIVAFKIMTDIFEQRKVGRIPPLFLIVEEAHNFCPEKEVRTSSKIIRSIASEGRKFGLGLCIISQRPARVDKNVLSQCNTQIIMKITNPNDLKAVSYAEGITSGLENEIKNLNPGTALILGREMPLFVDIRTRRTKHGGVTVSVTDQPKITEGIMSFAGISKQEIEIRLGKVKKIYYPCFRVSKSENHYLIDGMKGKILYRDGNRTRESSMDLTDDNLTVLSYLTKKMTKDELVQKSSMNYTNLISSLSTLISSGFAEEASENGTVTYSKTKKADLRTFDIEPVLVQIDGEVLKPALTKEQVYAKAKVLFNNFKDIELVYYPYIIGKDFMIDGISGIKQG